MYKHISKKINIVQCLLKIIRTNKILKYLLTKTYN